MGSLGSVLIAGVLELSAYIAGGIFLLRLFAGLRVSDLLKAWRVQKGAQNNKEGVKSIEENDAEGLSVGLMSKFLYPLILCKNVQIKSEQLTICESIQVRDEYRWLEDHQSAPTRRWLVEQGQCTRRALQKRKEQLLASGPRGVLEAYTKEVEACQAMENIDAVFQRGSRHFFYVRTGAAPHRTQLFVAEHVGVDTLGRAAGQSLLPLAQGARAERRRDEPEEVCRALLSTAEFRKGGTTTSTSPASASDTAQSSATALIGSWVCCEGISLAYATVATSPTGNADQKSQQQLVVTLRVRDVTSGVDLPADVLADGLHAANISVAWADGKSGFFYTRMVQARHAVYFHKLHTAQSEDVCVHTVPAVPVGPDAPATPSLASTKASDVREFYTLRMTSDSRYLLVSASDEIPSDTGHAPSTDAALLGRPNRLYCMDVKAGPRSKQDGIKFGPLLRLVDDSGGNFCWEYIASDTSSQEYWFRTNYRAKNFRIVRMTLPEAAAAQVLIDAGQDMGLRALLRETWVQCVEWVPEHPEKVLERALVATRSILVLKYLRRSTRAHDVYILDFLKPQPAESVRRPAAELPKEECDCVDGPWCNFNSSTIYYRTGSLSDPGRIWRAKVTRGLGGDSESSISFVSLEPLFTPSVPGFNMYDYETSEQVVVSLTESKGEHSALLFRERGETLPIRQSARARRMSSIKPHGSKENLAGGAPGPQASEFLAAASAAAIGRPCILVVYAGFETNAAPSFSAPLAFFAKCFRASVCVLNISTATSQDLAVNQILETAQHLIDLGVTSSSRLGLLAGTIGATLCAAALNKRPDMFGAVVLQNGIYDLLRAHMLNPPVNWIEEAPSAENNISSAADSSQPVAVAASTIRASVWASQLQLGDAASSAEMCTRLLQISPLHNVRAFWVRDDELCYPAVLVRTSGPDAAVNRAHSMKFSAELQRVWGANERADKPVLVDIDLPSLLKSPGAGAGASREAAKIAQDSAPSGTAFKDVETVLFLAQYCGDFSA